MSEGVTRANDDGNTVRKVEPFQKGGKSEVTQGLMGADLTTDCLEEQITSADM